MEYTQTQKQELDDKLQAIFDQRVPVSGNCETLGGEIARAAMRILYRWYNDGDEIGWGYGNETCNAPARFIIEKTERIGELCEVPNILYKYLNRLGGGSSAYENDIYRVIELITNYIESNPSWADTLNSEDMFDYREPEDVEYYGDEDEDEEY